MYDNLRPNIPLERRLKLLESLQSALRSLESQRKHIVDDHMALVHNEDASNMLSAAIDAIAPRDDQHIRNVVDMVTRDILSGNYTLTSEEAQHGP